METLTNTPRMGPLGKHDLYRYDPLKGSKEPLQERLESVGYEKAYNVYGGGTCVHTRVYRGNTGFVGVCNDFQAVLYCKVLEEDERLQCGPASGKRQMPCS